METETALASTNSGKTVTQGDVANLKDPYSAGNHKIIRNAHYRFQAKSVKESTDAIEKAVVIHHAYIASSSLSLQGSLLEGKMTIRVRSEYFQDLLKQIDQEALFVNFKNISTEDVSKQFVDLESRLKTKREVEARYMEILRKRAGTIEELFEAEKQIGALHEEIEATVSRLNFLKDQVSYSTITLEFYQTVSEVAAVEEEPILGQFDEAFATGFAGIVNVLISLAYIWPLIIIMATAFIIYVKKKQPSV